MIEEGRARRMASGVATRWKRYFDLSARLGPLRRVHALSTAGDAFTTVALAGSLFFSISPEAAKGKVILYLLLTMAPFGVVAPLLGPLFDRRRSSRRQLVAISLLARAVISLLMASNLHSLLLFPLAFSTRRNWSAVGGVWVMSTASSDTPRFFSHFSALRQVEHFG